MQYDWSPYRRRYQRGKTVQRNGVQLPSASQVERGVAKETSRLASGSQTHSLQSCEESGLISVMSHWCRALRLGQQSRQ